MAHNIPYVVFGGIGFYDRREVKDVLSYLRLAATGDDLSFKRIVNVPRRRMSKNIIEFLQARADNEGIGLYEMLKKYLHDPTFKGTGAETFVRAIEEARALADTAPVSEVLQRLLIDTGYTQYIRESGEMERLDNIAELVRSIVTAEAEYGDTLTLSTFIQSISLNRDIAEDENEKSDKVRIMTAHIAKGLEFPIVFVVGLTEKVFPSGRALEERLHKALEEERRLCYVAMTRAKQQLYLTESEGLGARGIAKTPSRFLFDIDDTHITRIGHIRSEIMEEHAIQTLLRNPRTDDRFPVGTAVKHKIFGEGIVEALDERTQVYTVRFLIGIKPIRFDFRNMWRGDGNN